MLIFGILLLIALDKPFFGNAVSVTIVTDVINNNINITKNTEWKFNISPINIINNSIDIGDADFSLTCISNIQCAINFINNNIAGLSLGDIQFHLISLSNIKILNNIFSTSFKIGVAENENGYFDIRNNFDSRTDEDVKESKFKYPFKSYIYTWDNNMKEIIFINNSLNSVVDFDNNTVDLLIIYNNTLFDIKCDYINQIKNYYIADNFYKNGTALIIPEDCFSGNRLDRLPDRFSSNILPIAASNKLTLSLTLPIIVIVILVLVFILIKYKTNLITNIKTKRLAQNNTTTNTDSTPKIYTKVPVQNFELNEV
ncbi:hypothetical protein [Carp edema virus]|nr:hypothetical protein [Carp edema virus]